MSSNILSEDLRSIKTKKSLYAAMFTLLHKHSFKKITIKRICEEALISRAAFYAHFIDKYDLLEHWMPELWPKDLNRDDPFEQMEKVINLHIRNNIPILKNLLHDADNETFDVLFDFALSTINLSSEKNKDALTKNVVLSNFYAGGMMSYFLWQVKHKFPADVPPINRDLYELIRTLNDWQSK